MNNFTSVDAKKDFMVVLYKAAMEKRHSLWWQRLSESP